MERNILSAEEYRKDPCGTLSIPYWKYREMPAPADIKIVHHRDFRDEYAVQYTDTSYFRLIHRLHSVSRTPMPGYSIRTIRLPQDMGDIVDIINQSYPDIRVTPDQIAGYCHTRVYDKNLWVLVQDTAACQGVGCGVADLDDDMKEGILEWVQVLPSYRQKGIGQRIVNELLYRMQGRASFATVFGRIDNPSRPERLYRKCGFTGNDVWHVLSPR